MRPQLGVWDKAPIANMAEIISSFLLKNKAPLDEIAFWWVLIESRQDQNVDVTRLVLNTDKLIGLDRLHWLSVQQRIEYMVCVCWSTSAYTNLPCQNVHTDVCICQQQLHSI